MKDIDSQRMVIHVRDARNRHDRIVPRPHRPALRARLLDLAVVVPGVRVLELATGRGEPAIAVAHRVGAGSYVRGVDVSAAALATARQGASREGVTCLDLRAMDAAAPADSPRRGLPRRAR